VIAGDVGPARAFEFQSALVEAAILPLPLGRPGYEPVRFLWRAPRYAVNRETDLLMQSGTDIRKVSAAIANQTTSLRDTSYATLCLTTRRNSSRWPLQRYRPGSLAMPAVTGLRCT